VRRAARRILTATLTSPARSPLESVLGFILGNFTLTFLVIGLVASALALARKPRPWSRGTIVEALLSYFLLFSIGFSYLYNFVCHVFFGELAARLIGWADSPFQTEVGFASLGFAVIGFLAFRRGTEMRTAAVVGPACFLWGAAGGHIYQVVTAGNYAPGNAGVVLYTDIVLPVIGFTLLWLQRKYPREQR
jgi:type IV secretory pathway VirB2 component (pilin)